QGVQSKEVPAAAIADTPIATGDPRAIAPTISTGTGNAGTGVNGIAGVDNIVSNADVTGLTTSVTGSVVGAVSSFSNSSFTSPVIITSIGHSLTTGAVVQVKGVQGIAAPGVWRITGLHPAH